MANREIKKLWFVDFPTYKYNEDVKALARKNDLKIRDSKYSGGVKKELVTSDAPKLTLKDEYKKKSK